MEYIIEAAGDTLRTLPLLLAVLIAIEALEHRFSGRFQRGLSRIGRWGPAVGAGIGAFPQCGGAVVVSELYAARAVTLGTLLAVYLATSDEALPILAASPAKVAMLGPLLLTKIAIGLVAGYTVDLAARRRSVLMSNRAIAAPSGTAIVTDFPVGHQHDPVGVSAYETQACLEGRLTLPALVLHALRRGIRIAAFLTVTTAALNWAGEAFTALPAGGLLLSTNAQVLASASFGLIPSCAPSVALTDLFVKGALGYPALIAGLCANAGAGLMVLLHEAGWRVVLRVAALLLVISVGAGLILALF